MADSLNLKDTFQLIERLYTHRPGQKIPAAVLDTIAAVWKHDLKPLIVKKKRHDSGWTIVVSLPPGIAYSEFKSKEMLFSDATNAAVQIEKRGGAVIMQIMAEQLKSYYSYEWDFSKYESMQLPIPIGFSAVGLLVRDLSSMVNLFTAGVPGQGKSNFLHTLAVSLLLSRPVYMVIIDLKKLEYSYLRNHALLATDIEQARMVLLAINQELDKRLGILEADGAVNIQEFKGDMKYIILMIDELAELQDEVCQTQLNRIVRLGRAAGICVIAATQRPSSTLFAKFGDSKAMFPANVCFAVRDAINSRMVLDNERASLIPRIKGRAIFQYDTELEIQAMHLPVQQAKQLLNNIQREVIAYDIATKRLPPR